MRVRFEKVVVPCVVNDVTLWHLEHGFLWDVVEEDGRRIGVFFCTLLCGDGCIVHFDTVPGMVIPWQSTLAAMRKGVRMIAEVGGVIYATIPAENRALIRVAVRLGFGLVCDGGFLRDGEPVVLLKYFPRRKGYITVREPIKERMFE